MMNFFRKYGLFTCAFIICLAFLIVVLFSLFLPSPQDTFKSISKIPTPIITDTFLQDANTAPVWQPFSFSENNLQGANIDKTQLNDGSMQYTYTSSNPGKPDVLIVKNGIIIFQKHSIFKKSINDYITLFKKPDYASLGSSFYGVASITYIFPNRGVSFVTLSNSGLVVEQSTFQPISINEYRQKYVDKAVIPAGEQKKESFNNGTTKYTYTSSIPDRPNIIITMNGNNIIFQRTVGGSGVLAFSDLTKNYGQAPWVFKGSINYGAQAQTYIYPDLGIAFIANPQTGEVFEQQLFTPTKVEDYVNKYGDDIPAQP